MRIASIFAAGTLTCVLALAAGRSTNIVYVDGNLTGVTRQSSGALAYSGAEALELKAGLAIQTVPYAGISKVGLSVPQQHSSDVPLYKVWALHKHFNKTETQMLTVEFKDDQGEARTMTVELGSSAATAVMNTIKLHNPSVETAALAQAPVTYNRADGPPQESKVSQADVAPQKNAWWGDKYWKTGRNTERWEKSAANAPE